MNFKVIMPILFLVLCAACKQPTDTHYNDGTITYKAHSLPPESEDLLQQKLDNYSGIYNPQLHLVERKIDQWNYHTDTIGVTYHLTRGSLQYARLLIMKGDKASLNRAHDILAAMLPLQDQDSSSRSFGVWPYYYEEPLESKKTQIDYNWADFNCVLLLDIWMQHQDKLEEEIKPRVKAAMIMAAESIKRRDVRMGYTNIAIMGTYATYMVSHLFDLASIKSYAIDRLHQFYDFTLQEGGFSEYNSPTYTIIALEELQRMRDHIIKPEHVTMIDSLYVIGWDEIARHWHKPTRQWAGPHSRSYSTLLQDNYQEVIHNNFVDAKTQEIRKGLGLHLEIPDQLKHYFVRPIYPRVEIDTFEREAPPMIGYTYLTEEYALSSISLSTLWNQRRPLLAYWGDASNPGYLQVRMLRNDYDFSSASVFCRQDSNQVLAGINFTTNGGNKHVLLDRLENGYFTANDLRLRFEFGNVDISDVTLPDQQNEVIKLSLQDFAMNIQMLNAVFGTYDITMETGKNGNISWIDFVIYTGEERSFELNKIDRAAFCFTLSMGDNTTQGQSNIKNDTLSAYFDHLKLNIPIKPDKQIKWFM